ncbi:MAG: DUF1285 domain-containing protein [Candidatus Competibacteraceae bacterium]|nr:DUF1285 domain-containing protein [Candidatus Competibacteraceae bacterium]
MSHPDPAALAAQLQDQSLPPVEQWDPPLSGEMDLHIRRDGNWLYQGSPIERPTLVRLFSTLLRREDDGLYYLLTPVEKWRIRVDDAPFLAVLLAVEGQGREQVLRFTTNLGDSVAAGPDHPLRVNYSPDGEPSPYVHIRDRLEALIGRSVFLELAELAEEGQVGERSWLGVWSRGVFFPLGPAEE